MRLNLWRLHVVIGSRNPAIYLCSNEMLVLMCRRLLIRLLSPLLLPFKANKFSIELLDKRRISNVLSSLISHSDLITSNFCNFKHFRTEKFIIWFDFYQYSIANSQIMIHVASHQHTILFSVWSSCLFLRIFPNLVNTHCHLD
uniref:Uncharacterized protein n=1 Tax=Cacopsylla melanoneura TaxID=428564 RepID=A0A8D8TR17_9HEMI